MMHKDGARQVHRGFTSMISLLTDLAEGLNPENFEFYLNPFRFGMPPHAGWDLVQSVL